MKASKHCLHFAAFALFTLGPLAANGQITPSQDAYTDTTAPTNNFGSRSLLLVQSATQTTFIQFDLSSLPAGYGSANVAKATLKLYVNAVATAGSFNVDFVSGTWSERTISANLSPALGTAIVSSVPLTNGSALDYINVDITPAVQAWLDGTQANDGIALVANSPLNANFDSKENTTNSHPPELDIVFTGSITGVTTAAGSGLTGGGTTGSLNLSLTNSCASRQGLQWNGSSWVCSSAGTGTVTNVASGAGLSGGPITSSGTLRIASAGVTNSMLANPSLTVSPGVGLTGGGPVALGGSTTLNVDTSKIPQLGTANSFTGIQTINGTLGINTSAPTQSLQIDKGNALVRGLNNFQIGGNSATLFLGDTNNFVRATFNQGVTVGVFGQSSALNIANGGNIGIGTTTPATALDVFAGAAGTHAPMAQFHSLGPNDANSIVVGNGSGSAEVFEAGALGNFVPGTVAGDGGLRVSPGKNMFFGDSGLARMELSSGGQALVGSQAVIGNTGCGAGFGGVGFGAASLADCGHYSLLGDSINTYLNRPAGGLMVFRENNATEMVLAAGGNLGIGTVTPGYLLHVNGTIRGEGGLSLGGAAPVAIDANGVVGGRLTVLANGNVGINNPNPQHTLDVNGPVSIGGDTAMTSNPHMSFSGMFPGSFCNAIGCGGNCSAFCGGPGGYFVPDRNIVVTRMTIVLASAADASCIGPTIGLAFQSNGNYIWYTSLNGAGYFVDSGPLSIPIPALTGVLIESGWAANCNIGTSGGGSAFVNVQYVMQ